MNLRLLPPDGFLEAKASLPLSKSITNRALLICSLTKGRQMPKQLAVCDDTAAMLKGLNTRQGEINVGLAGTAMRFLTAYYASTSGADVTLDGNERMRHRPIGPLVDALRRCGADIEYASSEGFPPLRIKGCQLQGGSVEIDASTSSQFVSALLMVAPVMAQGLKLRLSDDPVSLSYIDMTLAMMRQAGIDSAVRDGLDIDIAHTPYKPTAFDIEPDWSAASYWYEIEALTSGCVALPRLHSKSLQGDSATASIFAELGVQTEYDGEEPGTTDLIASPDLTPRLVHDFSLTPDLVQTVTVACCMLRVPFTFTGLQTLRIKETDRIAALQAEMLKIGANLRYEEPATLSWDGRLMPISELPVFETYGDHRMAMALAPVCIYLPGIVIKDSEVVNKSYPEFWSELQKAGFKLLLVEPNSPQ